MSYTFDKSVLDAQKFFDSLEKKEELQVIEVVSDADINEVKNLMNIISKLPESGFKYWSIRLKKLDTDQKVELLKYAIKEQLCIVDIIETLILMVNSSNNYNTEFFASENVLFTSIVEYLDICDGVEAEVNEVREKIAFYFLAVLKSYVNHPRFELTTSNNYEVVPPMYEFTLMMLDFFNISYILNTPKLNVPSFSEIPNNMKSNMRLLDVWCGKQNFVVSALTDLTKYIEEKVNSETNSEETNNG